MAQIIQFPSGATVANAVLQPVRKPTRTPPRPQVTPSAVTPIKPGRRVPKKNRDEDDSVIMHAGLARQWGDLSYSLAQTEPNSEQHRFAYHMAGIAQKLPRNNLRLFTTAEDVVQGVHRLWRRAKIASLEWEVCDERRLDSHSRGDEAAAAHWGAMQDVADAKRWLEYERLIRVPAKDLREVTTYKLHRDFQRGMGSIEWMRQFKPELAAIIDDELARLEAEKAARKAERAAKKGGAK